MRFVNFGSMHKSLGGTIIKGAMGRSLRQIRDAFPPAATEVLDPGGDGCITSAGEDELGEELEFVLDGELSFNTTSAIAGISDATGVSNRGDCEKRKLSLFWLGDLSEP